MQPDYTKPPADNDSWFKAFTIFSAIYLVIGGSTLAACAGCCGVAYWAVGSAFQLPELPPPGPEDLALIAQANELAKQHLPNPKTAFIYREPRVKRGEWYANVEGTIRQPPSTQRGYCVYFQKIDGVWQPIKVTFGSTIAWERPDP